MRQIRSLTRVITRNGCEVLTKDVPKEIDEVEALLALCKKLK